METYNGMTGAQLEDWASSQRYRYRQGTLSAEQISALNSIPGWTWDLKKNYLPFEEAITFVKSLDLKGRKEWEAYKRSGNKPENIPGCPWVVYANQGWVSIRHWLGARVFRPFEDAKNFVHSLGLTNCAAWETYCRSGRKPADIPSGPNQSYANKGWVGMGDWLGTGIAPPFCGQFRPFLEARAFAQSLGLQSSAEWLAYSRSGKKPTDIPAIPNSGYKGKGWAGWGDFLGTGNVYKKTFRPFVEARAFVQARNFAQSLKARTSKEYRSMQLPADMPNHADRTYKGKGWVSWEDFLGTAFLPFEEARVYVRTLGLKSSAEWRAYCKSGARLKTGNLPAFPDCVYKGKGWISWGDWLGTGNVWSRKTRRTP